MVPVPESEAQRRCRLLAGQNSSSLFVHEAATRHTPTVTYGKGRKPLCLDGRQFRPDQYAIPQDDSDDDTGTRTRPPASARERADARDSPLPDASSPEQPEPLKKRPDVPNLAGARLALTSTPLSTKGMTLGKSPSKPGHVRHPKKSSVTKKPRKSPGSGPNAEKKRRTSAKIRRLPVNELFLVTSPLHYDNIFEMESSPIDLDPISDPASLKRGMDDSPNREGAPTGIGQSTKAPLSVIRRRLKSHASKYKTPKRTQSGRSPLLGSTTPRSGDGFDSTELVLTYRARTRKLHQRKTPALQLCNALQMCPGPLPDVEFTAGGDGNEPGSIQLDVKQELVSSKPQTSPGLRSPTDLSRRRVDFSDHEQLIMAQLSSISAPERQASESEESEVEEDEVEIEETNSNANIGLGIEQHVPFEGGPLTTPSRAPAASQANADVQRTDASREGLEIEDDGSKSKTGVFLDFRELKAPGSFPRTSFSGARRMGVNEAIEDEDDGRERVRKINIDPAAGMCMLNPTSSSVRHTRPRSILKNSTQVVPESTTREEHTQANTRRNSMIDLAEESGYFSNAARTLREPSVTNHRIVPRRSIYFDSARVQVPDSESAVPETSPEPPDYTNASQLKMLQRADEAVYTSQSLPTASRDLRTLTRSVSREHGTLSQAVRRRPSLPFQSPVVVG